MVAAKSPDQMGLEYVERTAIAVRASPEQYAIQALGRPKTTNTVRCSKGGQTA
jgi:hypothetical protein